MNAADLPDGTIVGTISHAYIKRPRTARLTWKGTNGCELTDQEMDEILAWPEARVYPPVDGGVR
jgi:hypothetical protein